MENYYKSILANLAFFFLVFLVAFVQSDVNVTYFSQSKFLAVVEIIVLVYAVIVFLWSFAHRHSSANFYLRAFSLFPLLVLADIAGQNFLAIVLSSVLFLFILFGLFNENSSH